MPSCSCLSDEHLRTSAARSGFTRPLVDLKERIVAALPSLPPENPGERAWQLRAAVQRTSDQR
jgi:hypothetical protein